jgi:tetratricopeptide (TPR) repeat protein
VRPVKVANSRLIAKTDESKGTGLDATALKLANRGQWADLVAHLEGRSSSSPVGSRTNAWLAFAYMYLGKCDALHALAEKAKSVFDAGTVATESQAKPNGTKSGGKKSESTNGDAAQSQSEPSPTVRPADGHGPADASECYAVIIQAYDQICATKNANAASELALLPSWIRYEAIVNFTFAALSGKQGRYTDAVDYMERTVGAAPDFAWGYRTLGKLQQNRMKNLDKAEASYASALAIEPDLADVVDAIIDIKLSKNDFDGAIDIADEAIRSNSKTAENYYRLAQIFVRQWRMREALEELKKAITLEPNVGKYYRCRAGIRKSQGDINEALADQQQAVELAKDKAFELVELAGLNEVAGNTNRAADNLQEALKSDPNDQEGHDRLIALLTREKRTDDLIAEYKRFLGIKPKDLSAKLGLARALEDAGKTDLAIEQFKEAANLDQSNPEAHRQLGALRLKQQDYAAAAREYTHALNINPSSVPDLVALGYSYAQNDDYAQAEAAFVTALALQSLTQPNTLRASSSRLDLMRSLAVLLMDEGRYNEAAAQLESISAYSKGTDSAPMDTFRLLQAKALRDRTTPAGQALVTQFKALPKEQQAQQGEFLINTLLEAGKPDLALPLIDERQKEPGGDSSTKIRVLKSRALLLKGDSKGAQSLVAGMVLKDSKATPLELSDELVVLSQISAANGDLDAAAARALEASDKYAKNFNAYVQLGRIRLKQGKASDAMDLAKKALDVNQYVTKAYLLIGDAQSSSGKIKEASSSYRHAAELYPGLLEAHRSLLETLRKLSLKDEAKREEEQVAQMEKQN